MEEKQEKISLASTESILMDKADNSKIKIQLKRIINKKVRSYFIVSIKIEIICC